MLLSPLQSGLSVSWGRDGAACWSSVVEASLSKSVGHCVGADLLVEVPQSVSGSVTYCSVFGTDRTDAV